MKSANARTNSCQVSEEKRMEMDGKREGSGRKRRERREKFKEGMRVRLIWSGEYTVNGIERSKVKKKRLRKRNGRMMIMGVVDSCVPIMIKI